MAGRTEYKNNWQKENRDRINLTVSKGQKEIIMAHAEAHSESVTTFIQRAISEAVERDRIFDERKDHIATLADKYNVPIEDQEQLKELAGAFAALRPAIPDIEERYFSRLAPQPPKRREHQVFIAKRASDQ